jgi:hypothetical protein
VTAEDEVWSDDAELLNDESSLLDDVPVEDEESSLEELDESSLDELDESSLEELDESSLEELDESSPADVLAVVALSSDWLVLVGCVELVVEVLPSDPLAAIVPKAIANVASAAATTRRRIAATRRARARRRSRTKSEFEVGGGFEAMRAS